MIKYLRDYPKLTILLVSALVFMSNLGVLYVNIMEARNFVTAREMNEYGNWLLTTMNELPRYEKPPLPTWLTAISGLIFGMKNLFFLRLPAALVSMLMVWFFYKIGIKIHRNQKLSFISSLILITSFYIIFASRNGQWDIFTHGFMMGSIYFQYQFFKLNRKVWEHALLAAVFFGLSFLSKGPVSFYALWLPFILAFSLVYRFKNFRKKVTPFIVFLIIGIFIGASWFIYVRLADPAAFLEITREEAVNWASYNIRPFYYYWSFFTQSGIWTIPAFISLLYPYLRKRVSNKRAYKFTFLWTIFAVILLSLIPEKKSRYLLPVLIPLAMNTGFYIEYLVKKFSRLKNKAETIPVYFNFGLLASIGVLFPVGGYFFFRDRLDGLWFSFILTSISLFMIGVFMFIFLKNKRIERVFYLTVTFIVVIMTFGFPISKAFNSNTNFKNIDKLAQQADANNLNVYSFGEIAPEMLWLYGEAAPRIDTRSKMNIPSENEFGVLVTTSKDDEFKRIFSATNSLDFIETFDVNYTASPGEKAHKDRLLSNYYIVKRKNE